ncbi:MAG: hypothetical protein B7Y36_05070 [Novosphingobium sp. 28-62-57]|uniref:M48 family metallopeptidase n=1 Tax=unclassified Novosphingobium TaxID=2644732 RepID=UPI000BD41229|nr:MULTISPECIES: M48 family metallopeptidase [unclassified Novosphingobium]OYW50367.1 MAG: hypothetical protein B7Z34_05845 [Novosphingobium sp. 12-62-10]OYZ11529.1 MAG: hypothetical protein B7Y36_05070 [Novosphingobium sp. 28-62-57]OZA38698.1 MAG: hypothetical protein B7X92_03430 [Novosphingobium sp. 17-62-9]HQS68865.1 M48 family metallopeptidase [Novosphingobium sp.]
MLRISVPIKAGRQLLAATLALGSLVLPQPTARLAAQDVPWPVRLRQDMARVQQVEWRLRQAAGGLCRQSAADIGVGLDDRRAYAKADWPLLAQTLGMREWPVVASVAPDGPAAHSGLLPGDELAAIGGEPVNAIVARRKPGPLVAEALAEEIAATPPDQPVTLTIRRGGVATDILITPVRHCAARLVLETDRSVNAHSDTRNVSVSTGLVTLAQTDDELAMAAAHELAHIIHADRKGGGIGKRRRMEDAADSLGLQLLHCAHYDAARGIVLFDRLKSRDWLGFLRAPTHRSFGKRLERLASAIPLLTCPPKPEPAQ